MTHAVPPTIRPARPADVPAVVAMVHELAEYERAADQCHQRLEWSMLDWNPAAGFYAAIGAEQLTEWVPYRLDGAALAGLAAQVATPTQPAA